MSDCKIGIVEQTSEEVGSLASRAMRLPQTLMLPEIKTLGASLLSQRRRLESVELIPDPHRKGRAVLRFALRDSESIDLSIERHDVGVLARQCARILRQ